MALSNDLATLFAKTTQDKQETKKESTAYGKIVKEDGKEYVQLDGSDLLTPISSTTVVNEGDRVLVTIKNHTAIVTGDLTHPSASNKEVQEIGSKISEFEIVIADKVTTKELEAEIARIEKLRVDELEATNAKFETIEGKVAEIDTIKADVVEISGKVTAHEGEFTTLRADIADFKDVTAERVDAIEGDFHTLESDYATFEETVTNKLTANEASIKNLETNKLDATTADIKYANIDFSNIKEAAIEKLFSDSGIIKDLIMSEGKVTGELVGVTIKGDLIEGNTVKADKLVIQGEDGLYYKLNVNALGETTASSDEKYQNGLDGSVIVAESITAEKVAVDDLVAFGATIGGFHIDDHALYSGVKTAIDNTTDGIFLGDDGQVNIGNSNNYLKFYKDQNGAYKLEIQASSIKFGASNTTIEEAIEEANNKINDMQIGGRNLLLDTATWYGDDSCGDSITSNIDSEKGTLTITSTGGTSDDAWYIPPLSDYDYNKRIRLIDENLQIGDSFIFSMKIKSSDSTVLPKVQFKTFLEYYDFVGNLSSEYSVIYYKGIWTESYANHADPVQIVLDFSECVGTYVLKEAKFEKSTILTEWTPAPEDIETAKWDAIYIAEADATDKANTAETNATNAANEYTDSQITIVNKTITDEVAEINVTTNSISQKVSSVETTVSTKANASDVYNKTEVDTKIDDVEIGGRNLSLNTNQGTTNWGFNVGTKYIKPTMEEIEWLGQRALQVTTNGLNEEYTTTWKLIYYQDNNLYNILEPSTEYCLSFDCTNKHTGFGIQTGSSTLNMVKTYQFSFEEKVDENDETYYHLEFVFTTVDTLTRSEQYIYIQSNMNYMETAGNVIKYANLKVEKGNKPTDWTPAPEDDIAAIDALNSTTTQIKTQTAALEVKTNNIEASVSEVKTIQTTTQTSIDNINTEINTLSKSVDAKMTSEQVSIAIRSELANGVDKVSTSTGFTFDEEGLTISKTGSEMHTNIDEDGMTVKRNAEEVLVADSDGVKATNLIATTYLIVGNRSRFENFDQNGEARTGCFWLGGE